MVRSAWTWMVDRLAEPWVEPDPDEDNLYRAASVPAAESSSFSRFVQAAAVSAAAHAAILALLAQWMLFDPRDRQEFLWSFEEPRQLEQPEPELIYAMAEVADKQLNPLAAVALATAPLLNSEAELRSVTPTTPVDAPVELAPPPARIEAFQLDDVVVRTGAVGESVMNVDGAIDRLTQEIMDNLEQSKVLVVWLMDASISLAGDRAQVADRLDRVYDEIDALGGAEGDALTSAVVAYGKESRQLVAPSVDRRGVTDAIRRVPTDESGVENVFSTVAACAQRYQFQRVNERRKLLFIVWTDESGNDYARLEEAVRGCVLANIPVYIVGPSAMFGQERGTLSYKHVDGKTYRLPVDRGPDAVRQERIELPYWFRGDQLDTLHAGIGPFALTRLAQQTGGAYFIKDQAADRSPFSLEAMRPYMPEYDSVEEYVQRAMRSPLRKAVLAAVDLTRGRKLKGTPRLEFAPTGKTFFAELKKAQETVAFNSMTIQQALAVFDGKSMERDYEREPSPRWRAWHDLTLGRLLAMSVRCNEYNWACAVMKGKGADFVDQKSNRWRFHPDVKTHFGSQSERAAREAERLLKRCVSENPGTPWALLASRELEQPFGFTVDEAYVAPPPPPPPPPKSTAKPVKPPPPPPPPRGRTMEQPRRLPRPVETPLPKL